LRQNALIKYRDAIFGQREASLAILISILALLATFYQLYLQRVHNERSLKPLPQIDLGDFPQKLGVYLYNNGLGPLIVDRLVFLRDGQSYPTIDGCLELARQSYMQVHVTDLVKRVVLPNTCLTIFEASLEEAEPEAALEPVRKQLASIMLKVYGRDIYNHKIILERRFDWFSRFTPKSEATIKQG
jgi:hypothetical protein